jgi:hypothetical protein
MKHDPTKALILFDFKESPAAEELDQRRGSLSSAGPAESCEWRYIKTGAKAQDPNDAIHKEGKVSLLGFTVKTRAGVGGRGAWPDCYFAGRSAAAHSRTSGAMLSLRVSPRSVF